MTTAIGLRRALREQASDVLESWMLRFERSPTRLRRATTARMYASQAAALIEALGVAMAGDLAEVKPGSALTRELEQACAFLGGRFAAESATGFDVAALLFTLRDALQEFAEPDEAVAMSALFEWLSVLSLDAFATAGIQSLHERTADQLEAGTPVIQVAPKTAALLLVGAPTSAILDGLLSRAVLLAVSLGSTVLILDVSGLTEASLHGFPKILGAFAARELPPSIEVFLVGATAKVREACLDALSGSGKRLSAIERFDAAVEQALERSGYSIIRRPTPE